MLCQFDIVTYLTITKTLELNNSLLNIIPYHVGRHAVQHCLVDTVCDTVSIDTQVPASLTGVTSCHGHCMRAHSYATLGQCIDIIRDLAKTRVQGDLTWKPEGRDYFELIKIVVEYKLELKLLLIKIVVEYKLEFEYGQSRWREPVTPAEHTIQHCRVDNVGTHPIVNIVLQITSGGTHCWSPQNNNFHGCGMDG